MCRSVADRDKGSALVAAIGVAIIGLMLSLVVVSVSIVATRDAGRDRVRTVEIHAAESVLDTTVLSLETGAPCTVDPIVVGGGTTAVNVDVTIEYTDASKNPLTSCASGQIVGTPARAVVTAVATPVVSQPGGIEPERTIVATVDIYPVEQEVTGSAIFSAGSFSTGAGFQMSSVNPTDRARIWIDSGDWTCNTSVIINGDLIVANGTAKLDNATCRVTGEVWARTGFNSCCTPSTPPSVGGPVTVFNGNLALSNPNRFGSSVSVGGANPKGQIGTSYAWASTTVGGPVCSNNVGSPCGALPDYTPTGLPVITYAPGDWAGFVVKTPAQFAEEATIASWTGLTEAQKTTVRSQPCSPPGGKKINKGVINLTTQKTIYDMRGCTFGSASGGAAIQLKVFADTVFFSQSFSGPNGLVVTSGDGQPHTIYFIVPQGETWTPGNIGFTDTGSQIQEPMSAFMYTPAQLQFPNTANTRGQMYAGSVNVGQGNGVFKFLSVPLPNGYLSTSTEESSGFKVEVVGKHED
jgi:hypothetical protein